MPAPEVEAAAGGSGSATRLGPAPSVGLGSTSSLGRAGSLGVTVSRGWGLECIGSLDQGTQSTRFFLFDRDFRPLASHQVDLPQIRPQAG